MAPTVEMFAGGLAEVLVLDVTYMLAQTSLAAGMEVPMYCMRHLLQIMQ